MSFSFFFLKIRRPPSSPLFPYSTLFRSHPASPLRRHSVVAVVTAVHRLAPHDCDGTTAVPAYLEPTLRQDRRRLVGAHRPRNCLRIRRRNSARRVSTGDAARLHELHRPLVFPLFGGRR